MLAVLFRAPLTAVALAWELTRNERLLPLLLLSVTASCRSMDCIARKTALVAEDSVTAMTVTTSPWDGLALLKRFLHTQPRLIPLNAVPAAFP